MPLSLKQKYLEAVVPELKKRFGYANVVQIPKVSHVVVNRGVGEATAEPKVLEGVARELAEITGQKPLLTRAKKSISAFKVRAKMLVGCKVTLRGDRMYRFLNKLINIALPKIRDFRGISPKSFDGFGNYSLGIREQMIFPEVHYDKVDKVRGMDITIVTTTKQDEEARALLELLGMPFHKSTKGEK